MHVLLDIEGMHCASCTARVEAALREIPGVERVGVSLLTNQASVDIASDAVRIDELVRAVEHSGYHASHHQKSTTNVAGREGPLRALHAWRRRTIVAIVLLALLVILEYAGAIDHVARMWWQFPVAGSLYIVVGGPFFAGAWRRLRHGSTNMDTLIALGTGAAYGAGIHGLITHAPGMYFMDGGMILAFITLGKYLEARAKRQGSLAIERLLDLSPPVATVLVNLMPEKRTLVAINPGDTIVVRPGERVPLDAEVISGSSAVDESWLTGEPLPVEKTKGDAILAGSINGSGSLLARVRKSAGDSALAQVVELVRRSQESKTDVQRLADRVVSWFVPAVLAIAAITFVGWMSAVHEWEPALLAAVAVLVVACPCALGLATPTAILVASGRGAELGILIKEAHALELAGRLTTVVFDKTGTITLGRPSVVGFQSAPGISDVELLAVAAAAERLSQHPLADCIVSAAEERHATIPLAQSLAVEPGSGIRATIDGQSVLVGNERLLQQHGIGIGEWDSILTAQRASGATPLLVARAGLVLGAISVADTVAPESRDTISILQARGLKVVLLSGDHRATVEAMGREVGVDQTLAEVLPGEKAAVIQRLQDAGEIVAMVGDGINDAPALAASDLGIAIGRGADVAIEAADVVLAGSGLRGVIRTLNLAQATLRTIRQNLVWASLYNTVLLPLAALGILPPAAAAAAMAASSVSVVVNSLLLKRKRIDS